MMGKHCLVTHVYNKTVSVTGYDPKLGSLQGMQVISAALAYVDPLSGETLILRVHQAVHIPTMLNNLLCPMQMRLNDVILDDCPKFLHHNLRPHLGIEWPLYPGPMLYIPMFRDSDGD
jgi:hypothetical protein